MFQEPITFQSNHDRGFEIEVATFSDIRKNIEDTAPLARHDFYVIFHITQGKGTHFIDFRNYEIEIGDTLFLSKGQVHSFGMEKDIEGYLILFTEDFLNETVSRKGIISESPLFNFYMHSPILRGADSKNLDLESLFSQIFKEFNLEENLNQSEILKNYLELIILKAERLKPYTTEKQNSHALNEFQRFKSLLEKQVSHKRPVKDYAAELGFSPKKLNDLCRKFVNQSAKEFIDNRTILEMKRLLKTQNIPVKELTWAMGFEEPTNLVKYFKKHTGLTPGQFLKT